MPDVAARHYWFLPVRLLMSNRYNSIRKIVDYHGPLLQTHGTIDEVVPIDLARKLFAASPVATSVLSNCPTAITIRRTRPSTSKPLKDSWPACLRAMDQVVLEKLDRQLATFLRHKRHKMSTLFNALEAASDTALP